MTNTPPEKLTLKDYVLVGILLIILLYLVNFVVTKSNYFGKNENTNCWRTNSCPPISSSVCVSGDSDN